MARTQAQLLLERHTNGYRRSAAGGKRHTAAIPVGAPV